MIRHIRFIGLIGLIGLISLIGHAQASPEFLISWRAINYVPADYVGKIFPSKSTPIEIGFDLIDGGKIVNLSAYQIRWLLDNEALAAGQGLKTAQFSASKSGGNNHTIRIIIANYKGQELEEIITIPVASPETIISAKTADNQLPLGQHTLQILPHFFNANSSNDLSFKWSVNNRPVTGQPENPDFLNLNLESEDIPYETLLNISAAVQNSYNQLELAIKNINFIIR